MSVSHIPKSSHLSAPSGYADRDPDELSDNFNANHPIHHLVSQLGVAIIGTTDIFGSLLISALEAEEPTARFTLYSSLEEWFASASCGLERIVMLYFGVDGNMPSEQSFYSKLETFRALTHQPRLIVCANHAHQNRVLKALEIGAQGYIVPNMSLKVILRVIHLVDVGGVFVPASSFTGLPDVCQFSVVSNNPDFCGLSPRQILVAKALRTGTPNKIIAYDLNMCESTVKVHVRHIMKKLKAKNRTQIAYLTNAMFLEDDKD